MIRTISPLPFYLQLSLLLYFSPFLFPAYPVCYQRFKCEVEARDTLESFREVMEPLGAVHNLLFAVVLFLRGKKCILCIFLHNAKYQKLTTLFPKLVVYHDHVAKLHRCKISPIRLQQVLAFFPPYFCVRCRLKVNFNDQLNKQGGRLCSVMCSCLIILKSLGRDILLHHQKMINIYASEGSQEWNH